MRQQQLHRIQTAVARGQHQGRLPLRSSLVGIGAGLEQPLDHGRAAANRGQVHGRGPFPVGFPGIGAGSEQQVRQSEIVVVGGPLESRRSVGLRNIYVGFL